MEFVCFVNLKTFLIWEERIVCVACERCEGESSSVLMNLYSKYSISKYTAGPYSRDMLIHPLTSVALFRIG